MKNGMMWRMGVAWGGALALLAGCGGSGTEASGQKAASVLMVDGWVQPASVDQGVSNIKSRSALVTAPTPSRVSLGALDASKTASLGGGTAPRQVGTARDVVATRAAAQTQQQLQWKPTATGGKVAAISFSAEGAYGLRLGVVVKALQQGTVLRVYRQANASKVFQISGQEVLQRIERNAQAGDTTLDGQTWWTPDTGSDEAPLELELPVGAGANTYLCTGTLLNDSRSSGTPYFLTANHCISKQSEAASLQTDWFFRSPTCNSRTLSS